jgi:peroxiredoxin
MALAVGTTAPDFTLFDHKKNPHSLSSHSGRTVILVFFPAAFTGVCKAEMCSFQNAIQRLNAANADVIGVSKDSPFANNAFVEANDLQYPVLSDYNLETATAYDVLFENFAGMPGYTSSSRATFVIDAAGVIRHFHVTENPGVEPNYDEIFAAAEAL